MMVLLLKRFLNWNVTTRRPCEDVLHTQHAAATFDVVVIKSPDADEFVIMLPSHKQQILLHLYLTQELQIIGEELISAKLLPLLDLDGAKKLLVSIFLRVRITCNNSPICLSDYSLPICSWMFIFSPFMHFTNSR